MAQKAIILSPNDVAKLRAVERSARSGRRLEDVITDLGSTGAVNYRYPPGSASANAPPVTGRVKLAEHHLVTYDDPLTLPQITCEDTWVEGEFLGRKYKTKGAPSCRASVLRNSYYLRAYGPNIPALIQEAQFCFKQAVAAGLVAGVTVGMEAGSEAAFEAAKVAAWTYMKGCMKARASIDVFLMVEREGRWT